MSFFLDQDDYSCVGNEHNNRNEHHNDGEVLSEFNFLFDNGRNNDDDKDETESAQAHDDTFFSFQSMFDNSQALSESESNHESEPCITKSKSYSKSVSKEVEPLPSQSLISEKTAQPIPKAQPFASKSETKTQSQVVLKSRKPTSMKNADRPVKTQKSTEPPVNCTSLIAKSVNKREIDASCGSVEPSKKTKKATESGLTGNDMDLLVRSQKGGKAQQNDESYADDSQDVQDDEASTAFYLEQLSTEDYLPLQQTLSEIPAAVSKGQFVFQVAASIETLFKCTTAKQKSASIMLQESKEEAMHKVKMLFETAEARRLASQEALQQHTVQKLTQLTSTLDQIKTTQNELAQFKNLLSAFNTDLNEQ